MRCRSSASRGRKFLCYQDPDKRLVVFGSPRSFYLWGNLNHYSVKYTYLFVVLAVLASACSRPEKKAVSLIPYPAQLEFESGQFELQPDTRLVVNDQGKFSHEVGFLQSLMQKALGQSLAEGEGSP